MLTDLETCVIYFEYLLKICMGSNSVIQDTDGTYFDKFRPTRTFNSERRYNNIKS